MRTLRSSDLKAIAGLLDTLTLVTPEQVPARLVAGIVELIPGLLASYNELGPVTTRVTAVYPDDVYVPGLEEAFVRCIHQHPVIAAHAGERVHSADTISGHATPRQVRRLDLYQEFYGRWVSPTRSRSARPAQDRSRSAWRSAAAAGASPSATT
jgi:hypothetical protein